MRINKKISYQILNRLSNKLRSFIIKDGVVYLNLILQLLQLEVKVRMVTLLVCNLHGSVDFIAIELNLWLLNFLFLIILCYGSIRIEWVIILTVHHVFIEKVHSIISRLLFFYISILTRGMDY
jgi:hypothetical protein